MILSRGQYRATGLILMLLGLLMGAAGAGLAWKTIAVRAAAGQSKKDTINECKSRIAMLEFDVEEEKGAITATKSGLEEKGMQLLAEASQVALICPGWHLQKFCLGKKCEKPGVSLTITADPT